MTDPASMEIGLCWGTLQRASLFELIEAAGRHGFPTISVRPDMVIEAMSGEISERALRRLLIDAGVRVRVIDALTGGLPGMESAEAAARAGGRAGPAGEALCFRVAEMVECPIVSVSLFGGETTSSDELSDAIGGVASRAARRGLDLVIEFVPGTPVPDVASARAIIDACGATNCGILLDAWHLARSGGSVADVAALPQGMLGAFQLDDRTQPASETQYVPMTGRKLPGEGELPLHDLTRVVLANNSSITAEIEVFSDELRQLPIDEAARRTAQAVSAWRSRFA